MLGLPAWGAVRKLNAAPCSQSRVCARAARRLLRPAQCRSPAWAASRRCLFWSPLPNATQSQIPAAEVQERAAAVCYQDIDDAPDDDAGANALDGLFELAVHRAERALEHRGAGDKRRPGPGFEARRAFERPLAAEQIRDRARIAGKKIHGEMSGRDHRGKRRGAPVDGSEHQRRIGAHMRRGKPEKSRGPRVGLCGDDGAADGALSQRPPEQLRVDAFLVGLCHWSCPVEAQCRRLSRSIGPAYFFFDSPRRCNSGTTKSTNSWRLPGAERPRKSMNLPLAPVSKCHCSSRSTIMPGVPEATRMRSVMNFRPNSPTVRLGSVVFRISSKLPQCTFCAFTSAATSASRMSRRKCEKSSPYIEDSSISPASGGIASR